LFRYLAELENPEAFQQYEDRVRQQFEEVRAGAM
jgi:hypothetical protein